MRLFCLTILLNISLTAAAQSSLATNNTLLTDSIQNPCIQNASRLLDEAFVLMQKNYYRKDYIDWDTLKNAARSKLTTAPNCEDPYDAINWCFQQIKEKHSFVMPTIRAMQYNNDVAYLNVVPAMNTLLGPIRGEWVAHGVAYINVPWVSTTDEVICARIADSIQDLIATLDERNISNWIVDLRNNKGGNCWPMIAGIGPLVGNGVCGYFIKDMDRVSISYKDGSACQGKAVRCKTTKPYQLKSSSIKIAVLTNNSTSSSGEIVALAFKGKDNVRFFGEPTAGYTTANATYTLSDKSMLVLTVCQEADRNGKVYTGRILPDVTISSDPQSDPIKEAAIAWLNN